MSKGSVQARTVPILTAILKSAACLIIGFMAFILLLRYEEFRLPAYSAIYQATYLFHEPLNGPHVVAKFGAEQDWMAQLVRFETSVLIAVPIAVVTLLSGILNRYRLWLAILLNLPFLLIFLFGPLLGLSPAVKALWSFVYLTEILCLNWMIERVGQRARS